MRFVTAVAFVCLLVIDVSAAPCDSLKAQTVPEDVAGVMRTNGRSLKFQQVDMGVGQGKLFCHIYRAEKNYIIDIFRPRSTGTFRRLNSIDIGDAPHSQQLSLSFRWLQPKHWKGPILLLYDQDCPGDWDASWDAIVLPEGFEGRFIKQTFFYKGIGGTIIYSSFDSYDERGLLVVTYHEAHEGTGRQIPYFWNGNGFIERSPRYMVIGPLFKTHAQTKDFLEKYLRCFSRRRYAWFADSAFSLLQGAWAKTWLSGKRRSTLRVAKAGRSDCRLFASALNPLLGGASLLSGE